MHDILRKTHSQFNINILKVRDYYFDKARIANNEWKRRCLLAPIYLSTVGMLGLSVLYYCLKPGTEDYAIVQAFDDWLDVIVGVVAIFSFIIASLIQNYIDENLEISNEFREWYDCRVFGIAPNRFFSCLSEEERYKHLQLAQKVPDSSKYEVWYRETFSEDNYANAICLMMDNVIYTFYVYKAYLRRINRTLAIIAGVFLLYTCFFIFCKASNILVLVNPFVLFMAVFDEIKELIESAAVAKDLEEDNRRLKNYVLENADAIKSSSDKGQTLRALQDVVLTNRSKSLFIPKPIRDQFLANDCIYYQELDEVKHIFWEENVYKPEKSSDFDVSVPLEKDSSGESYVSMDSIHDELRSMLVDIKQALDDAGISFMLDGGTLIGAMRESENHSFIPWDDDIDISVRSEDAVKAMDAINNAVGDKYSLQDYYNDSFYSPRLSRFRVRQKECQSFIEEKDSELYNKYKFRGLFIDVYAYSPVLYSVKIDSLYRKLFIHPLYKKIRQAETECIYGDESVKSEIKFHKLKKRYMKRSEWYKAHSKCKDYYAYEPHYLDNINKPGPYIKGTDLYGDNITTGLFEGMICEVPANPDKILEAFYGKNWNKSLLVPIEELKKLGTSMYSKDSFDASCYKHIKSVWLHK